MRSVLNTKPTVPAPINESSSQFKSSQDGIPQQKPPLLDQTQQTKNTQFQYKSCTTKMNDVTQQWQLPWQLVDGKA